MNLFRKSRGKIISATMLVVGMVILLAMSLTTKASNKVITKDVELDMYSYNFSGINEALMSDVDTSVVTVGRTGTVSYGQMKENANYRTYIAFNNLEEIIANNTVKSAKLILTEVKGSEAGADICVYKAYNSGKGQNVEVKTNEYRQVDIYTTLTSKGEFTEHVIDLTDYVNNVVCGGSKNYGIMLEQPHVTNLSARFYGVDNPTQLGYDHAPRFELVFE